VTVRRVRNPEAGPIPVRRHIGGNVKEQYGNVEVYVVGARSDVLVPTDGQQGVAYTAALSIPTMKEVTAALAQGFSEELARISKDLAPDSVELKLGLTLSGDLNAWVVGLKAENTLELTLTWDKLSA
jgi:hypothetical protein